MFILPRISLGERQAQTLSSSERSGRAEQKGGKARVFLTKRLFCVDVVGDPERDVSAGTLVFTLIIRVLKERFQRPCS